MEDVLGVVMAVAIILYVGASMRFGWGKTAKFTFGWMTLRLITWIVLLATGVGALIALGLWWDEIVSSMNTAWTRWNNLAQLALWAVGALIALGLLIAILAKGWWKVIKKIPLWVPLAIAGLIVVLSIKAEGLVLIASLFIAAAILYVIIFKMGPLLLKVGAVAIVLFLGYIIAAQIYSNFPALYAGWVGSETGGTIVEGCTGYNKNKPYNCGPLPTKKS